MFILFEKRDSRDNNDISNWDAMGYTDNKHKAKEWVEMNPEYRCYKFCSDIKF